jgi:hypothetical protein
MLSLASPVIVPADLPVVPEGRGNTFIVEGLRAPPGEFPFMVSIQKGSPETGYTHHCGGSILNPILVVTAAHCVPPSLKPSNLSASYSMIFLSIHKELRYLTIRIRIQRPQKQSPHVIYTVPIVIYAYMTYYASVHEIIKVHASI